MADRYSFFRDDSHKGATTAYCLNEVARPVFLLEKI